LEPVFGPCACEQLGERPRKFRIFRAPEVPERRWIYRFIEAEHFFDASVAIGRDHQVVPRQTRLGVGDADHHVVMKLTLLMMHEQVEAAPTSTYRIKERSQHALVREHFHRSWC